MQGLSRRMIKRLLAVCLLLLLLGAVCLAEGESAKEEALYYGFIGKRMPVRSSAGEDSYSLGYLEVGVKVDVYAKYRNWTRIDYGGRAGYVETKYIERVQRKNPFDGPMPGTSKHIAVAYVTEDTYFRPEGYRFATDVKAGSWLTVQSIADGRAYFPYMRLTDKQSVPLSRLQLYDFVPWNEAQPGDLLYTFTTFYSTSTTKEGNTGRMANIALAAKRLTGIHIRSGECFSYNAVCGPYTKENGYQSAPILSGEASMGYGGGVCQVASTIYNIALRLPTVIEDMNWHAQAGTSYLPAGFDATVSDTKDLVWRNILPYPVRLEFEVNEGVMTAFLFRDYEE